MAAGIALSLIIASGACASTLTYTASGSGGDGPESAKAVITTGSNSLSVALSSLVANPTAAGQEVSGIEIILTSVPTSTSLFSSSGILIDIASGGTATPDGGSITHWGAVSSGADIFLATAGIGSVGGKPIDLIIGNGPYTKANSSITGRNPQIQNTGTFVLSLIGEPNPTISSVIFEFGTGPDNTLDGSLVVTPLPAALPLFAGGLGLMGFVARGRRRKAL
jgi:hypothetical protein